MRPIMPPVSTPDNKFHDGNPLTGELGTVVTADHLNNEQDAIRDIQGELIAILTAAGKVPESTAGQLLAALKLIFAEKTGSLGALASLTGAKDKLPYFTGADAAALTALTAAGRELIGKADVAAILTYLGLGDGGFVSANGGEYDKTFSFGRVEIIPNESNGAALYSADGSLPENSIVSGVEFHWFGHQFNIGIMRDAAEGTAGLAIQYNGRSVAAVNPAGDLIAERGVFESQGQVRVYSPNNPPPGPQGVRLGARTQLSPNTLYDGFVVVDFQASSGVTGMGGRPLQTLVNGVWVTVGVV